MVLEFRSQGRGFRLGYMHRRLRPGDLSWKSSIRMFDACNSTGKEAFRKHPHYLLASAVAIASLK